MKVENKSINDVLSKNSSSFFIPPFQRAYSWGKQEIDRYYDDIVRIIKSELNVNERDKREHFFGVLVLKPEMIGFAALEVVVDGQQRLTTTLLMLIALRDWIDDKEMKKQLEDMYLKNSTSTFSDKIKLKQVTKDWDAYRALVNESEQIPGKITDGYNQFRSKLEKSGFRVEDYVKALSRMNVACIFLDERPYKGEDPQIIFETLNSLGKPLSFADLIRNYIMLGLSSNDQTEIYDKIWYPKIEHILHERTSHFFRDVMQYKESKSFKVVTNNNTKELYAQFTQFVDKSYQNKKAFVKDASRFVELYRWIDEVEPAPAPVISRNVDKNKVIVELLRNIFHDIKADAFKPIVLGLLDYHQFGFNNKKLPDEQLIDALNVIRTYLIRRRILKLTQGENLEIPALCRSLNKERDLWFSNAKQEMLRLLSDRNYFLRIPNDTEITSELKRIDFYNGLKKYNKFILGKIEEARSKVAVNFRDKKITIEHVMPQSIEQSERWKREIGADFNDVKKMYLHNIGNLILTEFNSEMGNKPLEEKKKKLSESNLKYRLDITGRETWNKSDMLKHQNKMIKRFLETFSLPTEMQKAENWDNNKLVSNQELVSPLDDENDEMITGRNPNIISINDEQFEVSTWQDVYLTFLRWLSANKSLPFNSLLNIDSNLKYPHVATKQTLLTLAEDDSKIAEKFKRLSDGVLFSNVEEETEEEPLYVYIWLSSKFLIRRIREAMIQSNMEEGSVTIELKPVKQTTDNKSQTPQLSLC